jgi:hypothetical protein
MNIKQLLVLGAGAVLLVLNFLFPLTSYPLSTPTETGVKIEIHRAFMPIWEARAEHEKAALKGNPFDDTIIQWPMVLTFAAMIVLLSGYLCLQLGSKPTP